MSTFEVFLSFSFFFFVSFLYSQNYTPMAICEKTFLCTLSFLYMTNPFLYTHQNSFSLSHSLYTNTIHVWRFFLFFPTYTCGSYKSLFIYTRCTHTREFLFTHYLHTRNPFIHIFLLLIYINKNLFLFFMNMKFIHNASFFLSGFLVHFIFRRTFLNEKLYIVPELQQTLLTTMK